MLEKEMISKIVEFMIKAARYAKDSQNTIDQMSFKNDKIFSVVTETDVTISKMFRAFVDENFADLNHVIIDEESLDYLGADKYATVAASEYQFIIDPIDGTHTYALKVPDYAISIGIMKNCRPYMGCICLPSSNALIYFDGEKIHWLQNIYEDNYTDTIIENSELSSLAIIFGNEWFVKINDSYNLRQDTIMSLYACVVHFYYMITKRAKAYYFGSYIWDMAGSWPMLRALGFEFYDYNTRRVIEMFNPKDFNTKFKIKELAIVCREQDFDYLKEITDLRADIIS